MSALYLIACSASKAPHACAARDLYRGDLFRKSVEYVESLGERWAVLSALHGIVQPGDVVAPYDTTMADLSKFERGAWADRVTDQLVKIDPDRIVALAGRNYRDALTSWPRFRFCFPAGLAAPLEGLGIGYQKQWLAREAEPAQQELFA